LLRLLNDILDFSKIEARKLELEDRPFSLRERVGDALKLLASRAHEKGLELSSRIDPIVPDALTGDSGRLVQILINLVSNAIKFTECGEIAVRVESEQSDETSVLLHVSVSDSGIGIATEKQKLIFGAFTQVDASPSRAAGGTGLGLSITARLAELLQGRVWLESELGVGSAFHFTARFGRVRAAGAAAPGAAVTLQGLRALVVDDNSTNRKIFCEMLAEWGVEASTAAAGADALQEMRVSNTAGRPYALVLLDAVMPVIDGFAVAREIRDDAKLAASTVMLLSSADSSDDLFRCRELGIAAYVRKPVKHSELLSAIQASLGAESTRVGKSDATARGDHLGATRSLNILLAEDNPINQRVATSLLEARGHRLTSCGNGIEALRAMALESFDLVLMDVQMPEMDGLEATKAIRLGERESGAHVRIVAMTAHALKGDRERCLAAGMDDYVAKPVSEEELLRAVEQGSALERNAWPAHGRTEMQRLVWDREGALARVRGRTALLDNLIALYLQQVPTLLKQARAAIEGGDDSALARVAHTLKSSAASIGGVTVAAAAQALEDLGHADSSAGAEKVYAKVCEETEELRRQLATSDTSAGRERVG
jgi:two-component system, sensor histidine kinase and response regulator